MGLLYFGKEILGVDEHLGPGIASDKKDLTLLTIVFHSFVLMQIFNEINCTKLHSSEVNVFAGFCNNWIF